MRVLLSISASQNLVEIKAWTEILTPLCLDPKENPNKPPKHLQKLHDENAAF